MRTIFSVVEWPAAAVAWLWVKGVFASVRTTVEGAPVDGPAIYVSWHRHNVVLCAHHGAHRRWLLASPAPQLGPIRRLGQLLGLRMALGTSGDGGQRGLDELARALARGDSVAIAVDGPAGPAFKAKRGCATLAVRTGVPIVPMCYRTRSRQTLRWRWDRMLWLRWFDELTFVYGAPIDPRGLDQATLLARVEAALRALEPGDHRAPLS